MPLRMTLTTASMPATEAADHHQSGPLSTSPRLAATCIATTQQHMIRQASQDWARRKRWRRSVVSSTSTSVRDEAMSSRCRVGGVRGQD